MSSALGLGEDALRRTPSSAARRAAAQPGGVRAGDEPSPLRRQMAMAASHKHRVSHSGRAASVERERLANEREVEQRKLAARKQAESAPTWQMIEDSLDPASSWTDTSSVVTNSAASDTARSDISGSRRRRARVPGEGLRRIRSPTNSSGKPSINARLSIQSESDAAMSSTDASSSYDSRSVGDSEGHDRDRAQRSRRRSRSRTRGRNRRDTRSARAARARQQLPHRRSNAHNAADDSDDGNESDSVSSTSSSESDDWHSDSLVDMDTTRRHSRGQRRSNSRSRGWRWTGRAQRSRSRTRGRNRRDTRSARAARARQQLPHRRSNVHNAADDSDDENESDSVSSTSSSESDDWHSDSLVDMDTTRRHSRGRSRSESDDWHSDSLVDMDTTRRHSRGRSRSRSDQLGIEQEEMIEHAKRQAFDGWRQVVVRATVRKRRLRKDAEKARLERSQRIRQIEVGRQIREAIMEQYKDRMEDEEHQQQQALQQRSPVRLVHTLSARSRLGKSMSPLAMSPIHARSNSGQEGKQLQPTSTQSQQQGQLLQEQDPQSITRTVVTRATSPVHLRSNSGQEGKQLQSTSTQSQQRGQLQEQDSQSVARTVVTRATSPIHLRSNSGQEGKRTQSTSTQSQQRGQLQEQDSQSVARPVVHRVRGRRVQSVELSPGNPTDQPGQQQYNTTTQEHRPQSHPRTTPAERERAGVVEYQLPSPTTSPVDALSLRTQAEPRTAAHWGFLREACEPLTVSTLTDAGKSMHAVSALLLKVASEMYNEHTARNLAHGRTIHATTKGARVLENSASCATSALPLDMLARVLEQCGLDVRAAHNAQQELSTRVVQLEGLLAEKQSQHENLETLHAQVEYGVAQERKEMERRVGVADSARAQADKITKNCERKIAAARRETIDVAEKLRLAELELSKRQTSRDPAALRKQLERVRSEKVSLDQQLQGSEQRVKVLETEKADLARRLALESLDKTAKKRWSESKQLTHQIATAPRPTPTTPEPTVAVVSNVSTVGTNNGDNVKRTPPPTPPARPDQLSEVAAQKAAAQKAPLAPTLTNVSHFRYLSTATTAGSDGGGDGMASGRKHRPPPPAR